MPSPLPYPVLQHMVYVLGADPVHQRSKSVPTLSCSRFLDSLDQTDRHLTTINDRLPPGRSAPDFKEKLQAKRQAAKAKAAHAKAQAQAKARAAQGGAARGGAGPAAGPPGGGRGGAPMPSVEEMKGVLMQELQIGQMLSKQGACFELLQRL